MNTTLNIAYRSFRGESDYAVMQQIIATCSRADGSDFMPTLADITNNYAHLVNSDPAQDMRFVEVDGQPVGYARGEWLINVEGQWLGTVIGYVLPAYRRRGLGRALLQFGEERLRQVAGGLRESGKLPQNAECFFSNFVAQNETAKHALLMAAGYRPIRYAFDMVRPDLEDIPDLPLPPGLELRPVKPEEMRPIWEASNEAFRDHWGYVQPPEEEYDRWLHETINNPALWQVAWEGDQVAGMVLNFINANENEAMQRKRGYTENICVRRPWRKLGLAKALIARSLAMLKAVGMEHAALGVDAENISGATHLYEKMGYQVVKRNTIYRKAL